MSEAGRDGRGRQGTVHGPTPFYALARLNMLLELPLLLVFLKWFPGFGAPGLVVEATFAPWV